MMIVCLEVNMKSFKEYSKQTVDKTQAFTSEDAATAEELTQRIARAYDGKSNAAMLKNILTEAEKSKRAGTLSNEEIEAFYQSFAPMLDASQRKRLRVVVDRLKEI